MGIIWDIFVALLISLSGPNDKEEITLREPVTIEDRLVVEDSPSPELLKLEKKLTDITKQLCKDNTIPAEPWQIFFKINSQTASIECFKVSSRKDIHDISAVRELPIPVVKLSWTKITDLAPLQKMPIHTLELYSLKVKDYSILKDCPLQHLILACKDVTTIDWLQGKKLVTLDIDVTNIDSLSALKGMPIEKLTLNGEWGRRKKTYPPIDTTPLIGMPLKRVTIFSQRICDISFLKDTPLHYLELVDSGILQDLSALHGLQINSLRLNLHDHQYDLSPLEGMPLTDFKLTNAKDSDLSVLKSIDPKKLTHLAICASDLTDITFIKDFKNLKELYLPTNKIRSLKGLEELKLRRIDLRRNPIRDLSPLKGMPLYEISLNSTPISDLSPLKGSPLYFVELNYTKVKDISPIVNPDLRTLYMQETPITDLFPFKGSKIVNLYLRGTEINDLTPLIGLPLVTLDISYTNIATIPPALLKIKNLKKKVVQLNVKRKERDIF